MGEEHAQSFHSGLFASYYSCDPCPGSGGCGGCETQFLAFERHRIRRDAQTGNPLHGNPMSGALHLKMRFYAMSFKRKLCVARAPDYYSKLRESVFRSTPAMRQLVRSPRHLFGGPGTYTSTSELKDHALS